VQYLIQNHMPSHVFLPIITRDTPHVIPKPDPAGILYIAREWGLTNRAENLIMVGFFLYFIVFLEEIGKLIRVIGRG